MVDDLMTDEFANYVRNELTRRGMKLVDLASYLGVSHDKVSKSLSGVRRFTGEEVLAIKALFETPIRVEHGAARPEHGGLVPVYDVEASAGHGAVVSAEEHVYNLAFDPTFLKQMTNAKPRDLAIIRVKGDSMEPTLLDDDQVLVDRSKINLDFDGLFVIRYGEALHVKRVGRAPSRGKVYIRSDNDQYPPFEVDRQELDVVGRVLWYGRKV